MDNGYGSELTAKY